MYSHLEDVAIDVHILPLACLFEWHMDFGLVETVPYPYETMLAQGFTQPEHNTELTARDLQR